MNRIRRNASTLRALRTAKPLQANAIIRHSDYDLIKVLCECAHNVLKGNVPLTPRQKANLRRHKNALRLLTNKKDLSLTKKKNLLQKGGFLGALLGPVLSILGGLLNK